MTIDQQAVIDAALALPESDRLWLAERLLDTVPEKQDDLSDDDLLAELDRRRAEFTKDPSLAIPWSEVDKDE